MLCNNLGDFVHIYCYDRHTQLVCVGQVMFSHGLDPKQQFITKNGCERGGEMVLLYRGVVKVFERKRVIQYGANRKKSVKHTYSLVPYYGSLWTTERHSLDEKRTECDCFVVYPDFPYGLMICQNIKIDTELPKIKRWMSYNECYKPEQFSALMMRRIKNDRFIGAPEIEFVMQYDFVTASRMKEYHLEHCAHRPNHKKLWLLELQQEVDIIEKRIKKQIEEEEAKKRAHEIEILQGWDIGKSEARRRRMLNALEAGHYEDGEYVPIYKVLQEKIEDGWIPIEEEDIDSFLCMKMMGSKRKNPTKVRILKNDHYYIKINKEEYEFACHLLSKLK